MGGLEVILIALVLFLIIAAIDSRWTFLE